MIIFPAYCQIQPYGMELEQRRKPNCKVKTISRASSQDDGFAISGFNGGLRRVNVTSEKRRIGYIERRHDQILNAIDTRTLNWSLKNSTGSTFEIRLDCIPSVVKRDWINFREWHSTAFFLDITHW
jgi:hypothetical protein